MMQELHRGLLLVTALPRQPIFTMSDTLQDMRSVLSQEPQLTSFAEALNVTEP